MGAHNLGSVLVGNPSKSTLVAWTPGKEDQMDSTYYRFLLRANYTKLTVIAALPNLNLAIISVSYLNMFTTLELPLVSV
jgi:hypothetical protein